MTGELIVGTDRSSELRKLVKRMDEILRETGQEGMQITVWTRNEKTSYDVTIFHGGSGNVSSISRVEAL
jgi:hypothetical protein